MEALVEAFKLCVHQVVDHALEDGQVAAAHSLSEITSDMVSQF